ncbi:MAG: LysM peptidoglycan-binding domain-containing protein [Propionibacteriaceae bacterium]|nr:LysM peptidoglycan-binding domain-containing protein [Propionibacteriaceae bacterium]
MRTTAQSGNQGADGDSGAQADGVVPGDKEVQERRHVVQRGDDLWSLAERFYGDGMAWHRIARANPIITSPDQLDVGWELVLPGLPAERTAATENQEPRTGAGASGAVQGGADQQVTAPADPAHPTKPTRTQPSTGASQPQLGAAPTAAPRPNPVSTSAAESGADPSSAGASQSVEAGNPLAVDGGGQAPVERVAAEGSTPAEVSPADRIAYATAGISALTAAALLAALTTRRAVQMAGRDAGRRIVHPTGIGRGIESALGQAQDPVSLHALDLALRALGRHYRNSGEPLPVLRSVMVGDDGLLFEVDCLPDHPPPGFHVEGSSLRVSSAGHETLRARAGSLAAEPSPYPALVCLGETPRGELHLHDIESAGALVVEGAPELRQGLLNALLLELSCSWWGRGQSVIAVNGDAELATALDDPCVHVTTDLDAVIADLRAETTARHPVRSGDHPRDVRIRPELADAWRPHVVLIGAPMTPAQRSSLMELIAAHQVVVVTVDDAVPGPRFQLGEPLSRLTGQSAVRAQVLTRQSRDHLLDLLVATATSSTIPAPWWESPAGPDDTEQGRDAGLARGDLPSALSDGESPAGAGSSLGDQSSTGAGSSPSDDGRPRRAVPDEPLPARAQVPAVITRRPGPGGTIVSLAARRAAITPEEPAVDTYEPVLHSPSVGPASRPAADQPTVLLVGPTDLTGTRGEQPTRATRQCVEYAAWLLEHPGATASMMATELFVAETTRRSNMSRLRTWLGSTEAGERFLPEAYSGRIQLHPAVTSDWNRIQLLTIGGVSRTTDTNLRAVLELVRGAPLADAAPGQWHWAEELRTDISSLVRDVGLVLCEKALERGDLDEARWAINRALVAAPEDERLLAARVLTEYRAGNQSEVERLALRLVRSARRLNVDLTDETVTLLQQVMEGAPRQRSS